MRGSQIIVIKLTAKSRRSVICTCSHHVNQECLLGVNRVATKVTTLLVKILSLSTFEL